MNYELRKIDGIKVDFQDWNTFKGQYNSKSYKPKLPPVKRLILNAIKEFEEFCKHYHIDHTKYKYIDAAEFEGEWGQFDFVDEEERKIAVHSIIYREKTYEILQRVIDIGR